MPGLLHILYVDLVSFAQQNPGKITTNNIIAVQLRDIPACSIKVLFIFFSELDAPPPYFVGIVVLSLLARRRHIAAVKKRKV